MSRERADITEEHAFDAPAVPEHYFEFGLVAPFGADVAILTNAVIARMMPFDAVVLCLLTARTTGGERSGHYDAKLLVDGMTPDELRSALGAVRDLIYDGRFMRGDEIFVV